MKSYLSDKFNTDYFNSELDERVYDYVDEDDAEEYEGDYVETYINLCMGAIL